LGDSTFLEFQLSDPTVLIDSAIWYIADQIICPECDDVSVQLDTNDYVIVQTISQEGCKALDSILIQVSSEIEYQFPTIFSPNDDGINDIFKIPAVEAFDRIQRLLIFDRWGSVVHREENISIPDQQGWNGTLDGRFVVPGVYVVLLDVILKNGRNVKKAFDLTLIR
jgi:gliding motility-associated-like protein